MNTDIKSDWVRCPVCGGKTRNRIREDTELKNFPLFCPKCKKESVITVKGLKAEVIFADGKEHGQFYE